MARPQHAHSATSRSTIGVIAAAVVAVLLGTWAAVAFAQSPPDAEASSPVTSPTASGGTTAPGSGGVPVQPPPIRPVPTVSFNFVAVGDVLTHQAVLDSARKGSSYDFGPLFKPTKAYVRGADISICHLEVPVAPPGQKTSTYPVFGAPAKLVKDLAKVGWDGCSNASNHAVDRGFAGIVATLDAFQAAGLGHAGTARTEDESTQVQFYNVVEDGRTVKVAHISYAYGLNGLPVPAGKPWSVNVFNASTANVTPILNAAKDARKTGADVVIASVHCCVEYTTQPTETQKLIAQKIADSGLVDLYVGHHAHVPEPIRKLDGGPDGKGMWVAYGLGNFVSNQDATTVGHPETANGVMLRATFTVSPEDQVDVDVGWTAVTVDRTGGHVVYPISKNSGAVGGLSAATVRARWQLVADAVGDSAPEIKEPGKPLADFVWHNTRTP
jgi:poly-gamma-glutamate capsule biosynthesis protein CapA/YwtB (metallophosphatase superfamily)